VDPTQFNNIVALAAKVPPLSVADKKLIDELGAERFEELTKAFADRTLGDEKKNFANKNTVLSRDDLPLDLANDFAQHGTVKTQTKADGTTYEYVAYKSNKKFQFIQIEWVKHKIPGTTTNKKTKDGKGPGGIIVTANDEREEGHFEIRIIEQEIEIGVDIIPPGCGLKEISHLVPDASQTPTPKSALLIGTNPYIYNLDPITKGKGAGKGGRPVPGK